MGTCIPKKHSSKHIRSTVIHLESSQTPSLTTKYSLKKVLGQGKFGTVRKATHRNNAALKFAIKTIKKNDKIFDLAVLKREISILKSIDHPNIVKFFEYFEDEQEIHIVTEFCSGGELFERINTKGKLTEEEAAKYLIKIFAAVNYLHNIGISHRDLKPQNFLFESKDEDAEVKLIDFGLSTKSFNEVSGFRMTTMVGTPFYVAPEVLIGKYDKKCDLWSLGVTMYYMITGCYPFSGNSNQEIFQKIISATEADVNAMKEISFDAADLLKKLLVKNPQFRIGATEAIKHPWFANKEKPAKNDLKFLLNFHPKSLSQVAALALVVKYANGEKVKKLRDAFWSVDLEKKGFLISEDLRRAFSETGDEISAKQLSRVFKQLSVNCDGRIHFSEFLMAGLKGCDESLRNTFEILDWENRGNVEVETMIDIYLRNGKGCIDGNFKSEESERLNFDEFISLVN